MKFILAFVITWIMALPFLSVAQTPSEPSTLITNVAIFDGHDVITQRGSVRVRGDMMETVSKGKLSPFDNEKIIDGDGQFLMPGLIDAHVHVSWAFPFAQEQLANASYITATAVANAEKMLMRGFTTVRDTAGTDYWLAAAIDQNIIPGPRIIFAGRSLSQTGGHADHRGIKDPSSTEMTYGFGAIIADGESEVTKDARKELRRGAHFIKIHAGGGVSSRTDPLHSVQYSAQEMRAAV